jgi:hypothetical protein
VKDDAADHLHVEVAHADGTFAGFANDGEGFGQDGVEGSFFCGITLVCVFYSFDRGGNALAELGGFGAESFIGECLDFGFETVDLRDKGHETLDGAFVAGAKDFRYD